MQRQAPAPARRPQPLHCLLFQCPPETPVAPSASHPPPLLCPTRRMSARPSCSPSSGASAHCCPPAWRPRPTCRRCSTPSGRLLLACAPLRPAMAPAWSLPPLRAHTRMCLGPGACCVRQSGGLGACCARQSGGLGPAGWAPWWPDVACVAPAQRPHLPNGPVLTLRPPPLPTPRRVLAELPTDSLGAYVISMAKTASDVLAVVLLQRECGVREILRVVGAGCGPPPSAWTACLLECSALVVRVESGACV